MAKVSTGTDIFDEFLEGGYDTDILTTIYGPPASGKTTLCLLASISQAREKKKVIYIDTEGGFSIERLRQLSGADFEDILSHLVIIKPTSYEEQKDAIERLNKIITPKIGLIVIDTLTMFYRLELSKSQGEKGEIKEVNKNLISQLSALTEVVRKRNIPVLITNQVYSGFDKKEEVRMVGGSILEYSSKCLIKLQTLTGNKRKATLVTCRSIPEGKEVTYAIINEGVISA